MAAPKAAWSHELLYSKIPSLAAGYFIVVYDDETLAWTRQSMFPEPDRSLKNAGPYARDFLLSGASGAHMILVAAARGDYGSPDLQYTAVQATPAQPAKPKPVPISFRMSDGSCYFGCDQTKTKPCRHLTAS
jgi:hypothetical protein